MSYVDGFVLPVPTKNLAAYRKMAQKAGKIWREHGAIQYFECAVEDMNVPMKNMATFPKAAKAKPGETVVFAWIMFKSRAHRDKVNAKVFKDPRLTADMTDKEMPFDMKRMVYGGFETIVEE